MKEDEIEFNELLTKNEFFQLIEAVRRDGQIDESESEKLVNWAIEKRNGAMCVELLIGGFLTVQGWKDGNPILQLSDDSINGATNFDSLEIPMLEESRC